MEELIDILITLIGRWLQSGKKPDVRNVAPLIQQTATQKARQAQARRVDVAKKTTPPRKPAAKAVGRRLNPATVAMAKPILTNTAPPPAMKPPIKAVNAKQIAPATRSTKVPLSAASIKKWLNPTTLQQQFILTEIFKPPVALREHQEIWSSK